MVARQCIPDFSTFGGEHSTLSATLGSGGLLTGALSDSEKPSESTCCTGSSPWSKTITEASAETLERAVKRLIVEKVDMEMAKVTNLVQISVKRESQSLRDQMAALRRDLAALQGSAPAAGSQAKGLDTLAHTTRNPKSTAERQAPAGPASGGMSTIPGLHVTPPSGPPTVQGLHSALVGYVSQAPAHPADGRLRAEAAQAGRSPSKSSSAGDVVTGFVDDFNLDLITSSKPLPAARRAHDDDDDDFNLDMICSSKPLPGGGAGRRRGGKRLSFASDALGGTQTPSLPSAACLSCMGRGCGVCNSEEHHGASAGEVPRLSRLPTASAGLCMDCEGRGCGMCSRSASTGRHGDKSLGHMSFRTSPCSRDSHAANPDCLACGGHGCGMCGSCHSEDPRHSFDVDNSWAPLERQQKKKLQPARAGIKDNASKAVSFLGGGGGQSRRRRGESAEVHKGRGDLDFGVRDSADEFGGFLA